MNQERFDELAKGLATSRLSRRQVLKAVGASMIAVTLSVFQARRVAAAPFTVSCDESECIDRAEEAYDQDVNDCATQVDECFDDPFIPPTACGGVLLGCRRQATALHRVRIAACKRTGGCRGACEICDNGTCKSRCTPPKTRCVGGVCVCPSDTSECGDTCCPTGQCCGGICCPNGQECCNGSCKDTKGDDPQNCGSCGNVCPSGNCDSGVCQDIGCDPPCGQCETCEAVTDPVGGTNFTCVPKSCPDGTPPDPASCECHCPAGQLDCEGICVD